MPTITQYAVHYTVHAARCNLCRWEYKGDFALLNAQTCELKGHPIFRYPIGMKVPYVLAGHLMTTWTIIGRVVKFREHTPLYRVVSTGNRVSLLAENYVETLLGRTTK